MQKLQGGCWSARDFWWPFLTIHAGWLQEFTPIRHNETKWCVKTLMERRPRGKKWTLVVKTGGLHEECGMWTMRGRQWPGSHCVGEEVRAFVQQHPKLSSPHP